MLHDSEEPLLEAILDSWDRNNTILVNLLRAIPEEALGAKASTSSASIAQLFMHIHFVRLVFLSEDAPEFARDLPEEEWRSERDPRRIELLLHESASAVREAVGSSIRKGKEMRLHYDHPLLFLQHMIWHDGYHHGQIKLALRAAGHELADEDAGPVTWDVWMDKSQSAGGSAAAKVVVAWWHDKRHSNQRSTDGDSSR